MTKILVIEDEDALLQEILDILGFEGFEAFGAENGVEGVRFAQELVPDLIICDIMMPQLDGYSVLRALQDNPATAMIPFIFLTSLADRKTVRYGMDLGADDYLTKPSAASELLAAVQARLAKRESAISYYGQPSEITQTGAAATERSLPSDDSPASSQTLVDHTIRGYRICEKIGEGGVGTVYRALQPAIGREVAIKVLRPKYAHNPEFIRRFETEAELVARLEHPHIVPVYDYWNSKAGAYLAMRWLRGGSMRAVIEKRKKWSLPQIARVLDQISDALSIAHGIGVIHRDLKPDNILLDEHENAYLTDFGLAKHLVDLPSSLPIQDRVRLRAILEQQYTEELGVTLHITNADKLVGTPAYLSPEQIFGNPLSLQTDIYSLGITLYELMVGEKPFSGTLSEVLMQHLHSPVPSVHKQRSDLPASIDAIIQRATAKDWEERYQDAASLAEDFRRICA